MQLKSIEDRLAGGEGLFYYSSCDCNQCSYFGFGLVASKEKTSALDEERKTRLQDGVPEISGYGGTTEETQ